MFSVPLNFFFYLTKNPYGYKHTKNTEKSTEQDTEVKRRPTHVNGQPLARRVCSTVHPTPEDPKLFHSFRKSSEVPNRTNANRFPTIRFYIEILIILSEAGDFQHL